MKISKCPQSDALFLHFLIRELIFKNILRRKIFCLMDGSSSRIHMGLKPRSCKHGRKRCKECGVGRCQHGTRNDRCRECGTGYCKHNSRKERCRECGTAYCQHGKYKECCRECGIGYCKHDRVKRKCKECKIIFH